MCRMFGFEGTPDFGAVLQKALIEAATKDEFSANKISHDDGWGGVWYSDSDQSYVRSSLAIFEDGRANEFFRSNNKLITAVVHARKAATNEPVRGPYDSHPFSTHLGENLVYVTHNGHVAKLRSYCEALGVDVSELNDTEVFTYLLEKQNGSVEERVRKTIDLVYQPESAIGALNLIILSLDRKGNRKVYHYCDYPDPSKELYYSLFTLRQDSGECAVMSSTVAYKGGLVDSSGEPVKSEVKKCPKGELGYL